MGNKPGVSELPKSISDRGGTNAKMTKAVMSTWRETITDERQRTITLRDERSERDTRRLWAYLDEAGTLHIDGQDLGPATGPVSGDGEYEWFSTIRAVDVPRLVELLGGETGTDVLNLLSVGCTGDGSYKLERILRESGIPVQRFVY